MTDGQPNLFRYATSELSQDAFICWLLAWADSKQREEDPALHEVGLAFVKQLFIASGTDCPDPPFSVEVERQVKGVDVVALVGSQYALVIEDKVHTSNHSDQLRRYREAMSNKHQDRELVCVYLKTGDQSSYREVESKGWATFGRSQYLEVLRSGAKSVSNAIFSDFLAHLEAQEADVQRYRAVPPEDWRQWDGAYRGLFMALQEKLDSGSWDYVPNAKGGFFGFWWGWQGIQDGDLYLQLEEDSLVVKVQVMNGDLRSKVRNMWSERVLESMSEHGFVRPKRFGHGRFMTVAQLSGDYRASGSDGLLNLDATANLLKEVTQSVASLAAAHPQ